MLKKEITSYELAEIAREKGFKTVCENQYTNNKFLSKNYVNDTKKPWLNAPSYSQLIDWIFKYNLDFSEEVEEGTKVWGMLEWLEFWYELLKDCPLKYEFKGRLLDWFNITGYEVIISNTYYHILSTKKEFINTFSTKTKGVAEHEGIIKTFKLIKETT